MPLVFEYLFAKGGKSGILLLTSSADTETADDIPKGIAKGLAAAEDDDFTLIGKLDPIEGLIGLSQGLEGGGGHLECDDRKGLLHRYIIACDVGIIHTFHQNGMARLIGNGDHRIDPDSRRLFADLFAQGAGTLQGEGRCRFFYFLEDIFGQDFDALFIHGFISQAAP